LQFAQANTQPKIAIELTLPTQTKLFLKNFPTLQKIKNTPTHSQQTQQTMTLKHNIDKAYNDTVDRRPAGNSVYVAIAGEVVNRRSVLLKNFVLNGQVSASNPLLHIHANRYDAIMFFLIVQSN